MEKIEGDIVDGIKDIEPVRNDQHLPQQLQDLAKPLAEIALVLIGLSYLAGFLVTYTFQSRLGIHDANAEFLRISYIHTGLLCIALPLFIVVPITAHYWMCTTQDDYIDLFNTAQSEGKTVGKSHWQYTIQILCVSLCLSVYVLFEPYGQFHDHLWRVAALLVMLIIQVGPAKKYLGFTAGNERPVMRTVLAVLSVGLLVLAVQGTILYLLVIFRKALSYIIFVSALTYYLTNSLDSKITFWYPGQKQGVHLTRWAIVITLSILSVLTFAYRVYPYIPADKGGGNFHFSRDAKICMFAEGMLPTAIRDISDKSCSVQLKIIEITDTTTYVARNDDRGKNEMGNKPKADDREAAEVWSDGYFPDVYAISRLKIAYIEYKLPR
jgi:hypothetical protein